MNRQVGDACVLCSPRGLVSLWEIMQKLALKDVWEIVGLLQDHSINLYMVEHQPDAPLRPDEIGALRGALSRLRSACERWGLPTSAATLARMIDQPPQRSRELEIVVAVVKDEIASRLFFFVPAERARYFERDVPWKAAFPATAHDAVEAGNAFAAALYTACVFHCMRVLERGLHVLTIHAGVIAARPLATQNWAALIDQVEATIRARRAAPGATSADPDIRFCSEAAAQFFVFKEAWRNQAAHVRAVYTESQARDILQAVDAFMAHLATRLSE